LAVRFHGLSDKPLWLDEIFTQRRANLPISDLIANSLSNKHFPTYFVLVRAFAAPIIDEWTLRLPSAIFGAISVLLVVLIATAARSPRAGLVAGLLMALSPFEVQFGQEARSYALVSCFVLFALWGLVRIAQQPLIDVSSSSRPKSLLGAWAAYTIGTIGTLNVLLVSAPWLLASNLAMAAIVRRAGPKRMELVRNWGLTQAIILLTWLPGLVAIYQAAHEDPLRGFRWIPPSTLEHVWSVISAVYLFQASDIITFELLPTFVPGFGAAVVALALLGAWHLRANPTLLSVIGLTVIAMPITIMVVSIFHTILLPRYLIWSTGPFFVLAGIGVTALPRRLFPVAASALAVGGIANLAPYYGYETKPRWDKAAAYLAANVQPGDSIVTNDAMARYVLGAYGDRYDLDRKILNTASNMADAATRYAQEERLWVVYGRTGQGIIGTEETYLQNWLAFGAPASKTRFGQHIVVLRFEPVGAVPRTSAIILELRTKLQTIE
jgi:4-amino-4-deoxy-L-arabinose transferase-like glycosyltransferase